jgi:hypothetical protein
MWWATRRFHTNSTTSAPIVAPIKPALWSSRYQPTVWPMNVAMNAPAMPSTVVRMKPLESFGPGESIRAISPAMKPIRTTQMMDDTILSAMKHQNNT